MIFSMNSWLPDQYNMIGMSIGMMQNHMPPPPDGMLHMMGAGRQDWNQTLGPSGGPGNNIAPVPPVDDDTMDLTQDEPDKKGPGDQGLRGRQLGNYQGNHNNRDNRWNNRDSKDGGRLDRSDRSKRPRSYDRSHDRGDRGRSDHRGDNRDRISRFGPRENPPITGMPAMPGSGAPNHIMMLPGMMPFGNNLMSGQPPMDIPNIPHIPHMPNMPDVPNIMPNMHPNMMGNMVPNIPRLMDQNMMMSQQQMQMLSHIFLQSGVLLTPIQGLSMPPRRERPTGCRTIFVGGLLPSIGMDVINEIFQRFGAIDDIKLHKQGICHIRFMKQETVEQSFYLSGFRFRTHDQSENEATTLFIDYALNRDDQLETERNREPTPPRIEPFTHTALTDLIEKIKSDSDFADAAPTLAGWLEKGECNKKNASTFYSLIQACNSQVRRLYNDKIAIDEEYLNQKTTLKEKFAHIILQFEQVAKILSAAKHKRTSDHFTKHQRRNIEMWLKMTEDLGNIKEEFNSLFEDEETEKVGPKDSAEKYDQLKAENDTLICELEGYRNEAQLLKDEAERKFETFKAHYIAQQALNGGRPSHQVGIIPLPPPPPMPSLLNETNVKQEGKLVAILTAFLLAHPLGATIDYLTSYIRSMIPGATQSSIKDVLIKYTDVFSRTDKGRWTFVLFDNVKQENQ